MTFFAAQRPWALTVQRYARTWHILNKRTNLWVGDRTSMIDNIQHSRERYSDSALYDIRGENCRDENLPGGISEHGREVRQSHPPAHVALQEMQWPSRMTGSQTQKNGRGCGCEQKGYGTGQSASIRCRVQNEDCTGQMMSCIVASDVMFMAQ